MAIFVLIGFIIIGLSVLFIVLATEIYLQLTIIRKYESISNSLIARYLIGVFTTQKEIFKNTKVDIKTNIERSILLENYETVHIKPDKEGDFIILKPSKKFAQFLAKTKLDKDEEISNEIYVRATKYIYDENLESNNNSHCLYAFKIFIFIWMFTVNVYKNIIFKFNIFKKKISKEIFFNYKLNKTSFSHINNSVYSSSIIEAYDNISSKIEVLDDTGYLKGYDEYLSIFKVFSIHYFPNEINYPFIIIKYKLKKTGSQLKLDIAFKMHVSKKDDGIVSEEYM